jgi:hypothetical protein
LVITAQRSMEVPALVNRTVALEALAVVGFRLSAQRRTGTTRDMKVVITPEVGRAMIRAARDGAPKRTLENIDICDLAAVR